MSISTPFIRRPIATSLLMAALVLVGIAAYPLLPVAPLPRVDFPTIAGQRQLPGASPETMAATVAQPLETAVRADPRRGAAHLGQRAGQSPDHGAVRPRPQHRRRGAATSRRRSTPPAAQLPKNLPGPPTYRKVNPSDAPILILAVQSDAMPLTEVDDYADNVLSQQISQIAGVAQVLIGGEQKPCGAGAGRSRQARRDGHDAGGRAQPAGQRHRRCAEGQHRRRAPGASRSTTTTS